jgi:hypothetical protein
MFDKEPIEEIRRARLRWEAEAVRAAAVRGDEPHGCQHDPDLTVRPVYTPAEVADQDVDYLRDLGSRVSIRSRAGSSAIPGRL